MGNLSPRAMRASTLQRNASTSVGKNGQSTPWAQGDASPHGSIGTERRRKLMERLRARKGPIAGGELARQFHVSRQCLVQDVAILRARGEEILSTPRGYR